MKKTSLISLVLSLVFILFPLVEMTLNLFGMPAESSYRIWLMALYIPAAIGFLICPKYLEKSDCYKLPVYIMIGFGIWCIICALLSKTPTVAFFGFVPLSDCISVYASYFSFVLLGLTIASEKKHILLLANIFLATVSILSIISLIDNGFSQKVFTNEATNTFQYQAVYFNTNQFGYHLTIATIINAYLLSYSEQKKHKLIYLITFIILTNMIILNNTMGSYLAILLAFFFALIWSFINKEDKKRPAIILALFLGLSLISLLYTSNTVDSFRSMFADASTLINSTTEEEIAAIGSNRGALWTTALSIIKFSPIVGFGPQSINFSAHNMFLQIAMYVGIVGLIIYLAIFIFGAIRLFILRHELTPTTKACAFAVIGYLISGFFGVTAFYTAPYFYLVLGICLAGCSKKETAE